jgi:hypothetical protein
MFSKRLSKLSILVSHLPSGGIRSENQSEKPMLKILFFCPILLLAYQAGVWDEKKILLCCFCRKILSKRIILNSFLVIITCENTDIHFILFSNI